jgi:hypothetical protein
MSDLDTSFDDLFPGPEAAPAPAPAEAPAAAPPVSAEEVAALRQQNTQQEQRLKDAGRYLLGEPAQPTGPPQITDPIAYAQSVQQLSAQAAAQSTSHQIELYQAVSEAESQNPHLKPFENEIRIRAEQIHAEKVRRGEPASPKITIAQAVKEYNDKLQGYQTATQTQTLNAAVKQNALPFANQSTGQPQATGITTMKDALAYATDAHGKIIPDRWAQVQQAKKQGRLQ